MKSKEQSSLINVDKLLSILSNLFNKNYANKRVTFFFSFECHDNKTSSVQIF